MYIKSIVSPPRQTVAGRGRAERVFMVVVQRDSTV